MSAGMSRREFFTRLLPRGQAQPDRGAAAFLPPEFTPGMLRAEAARMGLDAQQMTEAELAEAVLRAMRAQGLPGSGAPAV